MNGLLKFLGGPIESLVGTVGGIIDNLHMSGEEKAKAKIELAKVQNEFNIRVLQAEHEFAQAQKEVVIAETQSASWLARNWRPLLMLTFNYIILHNYVIAPLFGVPSVPIPGDMWDLLKLGITGYIVGRSGEKILPAMLEKK